MNLLDHTWVRIPAAAIVVVAGVVFGILFHMPAHLMVDTVNPQAPAGPVTQQTAYVQELPVDGPARITSISVLLATYGKRANSTSDVLAVYDSNGRMLGRKQLPAGTVVDNSFVAVPLKGAEVDRDSSVYVAISSSDGSRKDSITAWTTSSEAPGRLYAVPSGQIGDRLAVGQASTWSARTGALCVRVEGAGPHRLLAELLIKIAGALAALAVAVALVFAPAVRRRLQKAGSRIANAWNRLDERFQRSRLSGLGRALSEEHLLRFDLKTQLLCVAGLLLFMVLVATGTHFSSIEMWNTYVPSDQPGVSTSTLVAGTPKAIRSDEWLVSTPDLLHDYVAVDGMTAGREAMDAVSPWTWGLHVLGLERGFAFYWDFWVLGCFFGIFFLTQLLTRNRFSISVFTAFFVLFSSYNRWWDITVQVTAFSFLLVGAICFLQTRKRWNLMLAFIIVCVFGLKFAALGYPAWQVPLAYLVVFLLGARLLQASVRQDVRTLGRFKLGLGSAIVVLAIAAGALWYSRNASSIAAMLHTVYPGRRVSSGGDVGFYQFFSGYLDPFFDEAHFFAWNICEISSFYFLFPFVAAAILLERSYARSWSLRPEALSLTAYLALLTWYALIGFGGLFSRGLALNYVPGNRSVIALGLAGVLLVAIYLAEPSEQRWPLWQKALFPIVAFVLLAAFAYGFQHRYGYPDWHLALVVCAALAVALAALVFRQRPLFYVVMLLLVIVPSINTNPVSEGLDSIYGKRITQAIMKAARAHPGQRWLAYQGLAMPELARAAGADVFNGVRFPPEASTMKLLAPGYERVWNRFAHISCEPTFSSRARLRLDQTDAYTLTVSPDNPALIKAGVDLFLVPKDDTRYFPRDEYRFLTRQPLNGYYIIERPS